MFRLTDLQNDKRSLRSAIVEETGIITSAYLAVAPGGPDSKYMSYLFLAYDTTKVFCSMGGGLQQYASDIKRNGLELARINVLCLMFSVWKPFEHKNYVECSSGPPANRPSQTSLCKERVRYPFMRMAPFFPFVIFGAMCGSEQIAAFDVLKIEIASGYKPLPNFIFKSSASHIA